jgi:5-methylcytosine-specific restriction endonuclease McrA
MIQQFYNDCPKGYQVDHIIPLALGGRHELANLQWLEESLNKAKGAKQPGEWEDPRPISCSP